MSSQSTSPTANNMWRANAQSSSEVIIPVETSWLTNSCPDLKAQFRDVLATAPQSSSWDTNLDPALEAQSRADWGIPPPHTVVKAKKSSYKWCMERKEEILAGHSSKSATKVFVLKCHFCERWFKHCMSSIAERKSELKTCRWCQAVDEEYYDRSQWAVHRHIDCNQSSAKKCK
ncbi:hypothetical protein IFR05_006015 [Cadophora sp. M221]|nr:hypothetical protein IFR05_006015 [Cadophora sp. M221]